MLVTSPYAGPRPAPYLGGNSDMTATWHNQKAVAICQLNQAIEIFLDKHDYYASATLAGASEEILGIMVAKLGKEHALAHIKSLICSMLTEEEKNAIGGERGLVASLNEYRNWLKHYIEGDQHFYMDSKAAAYELIERACENLVALGEKDTEQISRFAEYARLRYS